MPMWPRLVTDTHAAGKPIGFICIAPTIGAKVLGAHQVELTIGGDQDTANALEAAGSMS